MIRANFIVVNAFCIFFKLFYSFAEENGFYYRYSWEEVSFNHISSDPTGKYIISLNDDGGIISTDYGTTWSSTILESSKWISATITSDKNIYVCSDIVMKSINHGKSFFRTNYSGIDFDCNSITSDVSGRYLAIGGLVSIFTSNDYGETWSASENIPRLPWIVTSDITGQYVAAISPQSLGLMISTNFGKSFTSSIPNSQFFSYGYGNTSDSTNGPWNHIASSANGKQHVAVMGSHTS